MKDEDSEEVKKDVRVEGEGERGRGGGGEGADSTEVFLVRLVKTSLLVLFVCVCVPVYNRVLRPDLSSSARASSSAPPVPAQFAFPASMTPLAPDRLEWPSDEAEEEAFVLGLVARGRPAVVSGAPSDGWDALRGAPEWPRAEGWAGAPGDGPEGYGFVLRDVKVGTQRLFCPLRRGGAAAGVWAPEETVRTTYELHDLSVAEFLRRTDPAAPPPPGVEKRYHYFSGPVGRDFAASAGPWDRLAVPLPALNPGGKHTVQTVWMAEDGVVANMHYDRSHNLVTQLAGAKTWTVFPPSEAASLYLYPAEHPHYHSTAVDLMSARAGEAFPRFTSARGARFTARRGDLVYVPPYWAHTVESHGWSVTSSVISPSMEEARCGALEDVSALPLVFPPARSLAERGRALLALLDVVAERALRALEPAADAPPPGRALAALVARQLEGRYEFHWRAMLHATTPEMRAEVSRDGCFRSPGEAPDADTVADSAARVMAALDDVRQLEPSGDALADICLANLVERLARVALGRPNVAALLRFCAPAPRAPPAGEAPPPAPNAA